MPDHPDGAWFHAILTTYGSWLPGDPRGYRTRHHRGDVEGDYKNPPPKGQYDALHKSSRDSLKGEPVVLRPELRKLVCESIRDKLVELRATIACIAVAAQHGHVLVKMPPEMTRLWMGHAKRHAWHQLREAGWNGKLWAKRPKFIPIKDRAHQLNVYAYILRHEAEGAYVWKHNDGG
jgi:hypothetical protein